MRKPLKGIYFIWITLQINLNSLQNMATLKRITDWLEHHEYDCIHNYGLHDGKTGLIIIYFKLFELSENSIYETKARLLIDDLSEHIETVNDTSYEHGLAGIGWAIEWLAQNRFIEADTNDVLADMDDELYKSVVYAEPLKVPGLPLFIGKGLYFYRRLLSKNKDTDRYRMLCIQECLNLMIDEVCRILTGQNGNFTPGEPGGCSLEINAIAQSITFLSLIHSAGFNTESGKDMICKVSGFASEYLDLKVTTGQFVMADLKLIYAYSKAGQLLNDERYGERVGKAMAIFKPENSLNITDWLILKEIAPDQHPIFTMEDIDTKQKLTIPDIIRLIELEQSQSDLMGKKAGLADADYDQFLCLKSMAS
jgi:hypothetical protein